MKCGRVSTKLVPPLFTFCQNADKTPVDKSRRGALVLFGREWIGMQGQGFAFHVRRAAEEIERARIARHPAAISAHLAMAEEYWQRARAYVRLPRAANGNGSPDERIGGVTGTAA